MALTGALMSFEPQILGFAERHVRIAPSPQPGVERLGMNEMMAHAAGTKPGFRLTGIGIGSDPKASVQLQFASGGSVFMDPYTGKVLGGVSRLRALFNKIETIHRRLALGAFGKKIANACAAAFFLLIFSGFYLWWPRNWSRKALKAVTTFNPKLQGRARDWNFHNTIGFWSLPLFLVTTLTGLIMAYPGASNLLFRMAGSEPPAQVQQAGPKPAASDRVIHENPAAQGFPALDFEALMGIVQTQSPGWKSVQIRFPKEGQGPVTVSIQEKRKGSFLRSQLMLDPLSMRVLKWEPFSAASRGKRLRSWIRPLHTGQAAGWFGQILAFCSASGVMMMVVTGFAMAWRRFFGKKFKGSN